MPSTLMKMNRILNFWEIYDIILLNLQSVNDIYDTFFINNEKEFRYIGCKSKETLCNLENAITRAVEMITIKNNGKYELINDIELPSLEDQKIIQ